MTGEGSALTGFPCFWCCSEMCTSHFIWVELNVPQMALGRVFFSTASLAASRQQPLSRTWVQVLVKERHTSVDAQLSFDTSGQSVRAWDSGGRSPESQSQAPGQQHRRRLSTCGAKQILGPAPGLPRRGRGGGALQPVHLRTCRWSSRKLTAEESTERTAERGDHVWQRKLIRNGLETGALKELANAKASLQGEENAVETSMVTNAAEKMTGHLLTELYTRGSLKELRDHKVSLGCISELFPKGSNASFDSKEQQTGGKSILAEGMMCGKMQRQWGTKQANAPKTRIPCLQVENSAADKDRMQAFILQRWCFVAPRLVLVVQLSGLHLCWGFISAEELKDIVLCIP
ncbi:uncharacterized protein LOC110257942 [Sus scrofa]|uniref:uncharacterized protein LOC110257942 n=1 Tax=Sus scrofa TaxID=9823 RepID=UPI000A2B7E6B|nr:uncharacterized protein LOC110257942 [Sus scrofa]